MTISRASWEEYAEALKKISEEAAQKFREWYLRVENPYSEAGRLGLIYYANVLGEKYGSAAAELACEMYDMMAELEGVSIPAAEPAAVATYGEAAKTVNGVLKTSTNAEEISAAVGRLAKQAAADTILMNAYRDRPRKRSTGQKHRHSGAQFAWIPMGDTCAFCIMLASRGWQYQTKWAEGHHAEHIHSNCDCTYAVRFSNDTAFEGYNPDKYLSIYENAEGNKWKDKLNSMRREFYHENADKINEQKRSAYAKRKERESSSAEELNI